MKIWRAWAIAALFLAGASQSPLAAAATPAPEYEIVDGAIVAFGHRLLPGEPLPVHVVDRRRGRHFLGAEWHSDRVFEASWGGMGYTASLMFDAENPGDGRELDDLLLYDAGRDVYVRYLHDFETATDVIEIGSALSAAGETERFPIALDNECLSDSRFLIEAVEIDGSSLIVTYNTTAQGLVREELSLQLLGGAE